METDSKYCTLYIVRHGQAQANVDKIMGGVTDTELTEEGANQAKARAQDLAAIKFDAIFASDFIRAKKTAEILKLDRQLAVNTTELLRERNFGVYDGKAEELYFSENKEMFEKFEKLTDPEKKSFKFYPSFENDEELMSRFIVKLRELAVTYAGKNVLVVSHGSIMRTFLIHVGYGTWEQFPFGSLTNTAYIQVESDGVDFFVKNVVGHKNPN
jgi:broad specificity phosphatase PhoE